MKSLNQMDLEEWELLPDEGFLEINDDGGKKIYSRKYPKGSNSVFQMNYFICPPKPSPEFVENTGHHRRVPNQLVPVPVDLEPTTHGDQELVKKDEVTTKIPVEIKIMPPSPAPEKIKSFSTGLLAADQDPVSQVFFKKMKETEFVDMKVDSPRSSTPPSRGIMPQIEGTGAFQFEEKGDPCKEAKVDSEMVVKNNKNMELDLEEGEECGVNVWKWSLSGIGAICSFGVAAATFCVIIFSSGHQKNKHARQNQKLQFQIYSNDKRMKQVVHLNEAISAVRGVPITRAQITFGGYYDASL